MILGCGPGGMCTAIGGDRGGDSVVSCLYNGRGSGDGIRGSEKVSVVPTAVGGDSVGE